MLKQIYLRCFNLPNPQISEPEVLFTHNLLPNKNFLSVMKLFCNVRQV